MCKLIPCIKPILKKMYNFNCIIMIVFNYTCAYALG